MLGDSRLTPRTKARWTALAAGVLLLGIVTTGLFLGSQTRKQFLDIADGWSEFASEADRKGALISAIRGHLGYGGIIHSFKNYVLRKDEAYFQQLLDQLSQFDAAMGDYLSLPISDAERESLITIAMTIDAYRQKLLVAQQAAVDGWTAEQTDALVRVDDTSALAAFETLETIWQTNRKRQTERLITSVDRGQDLIRIGFMSMALLVVASLTLAFVFWTLLSQMQVSMTQLSGELEIRNRLEKRAQRLAQVVEQSPATIMITDTEGHVEYVNRHFEDLSGWSRDEVMGQTPKFLQSGDTEDSEYRQMQALLAEGKTWRGVLHNRKKDGGSYWVETTILPLRGADGSAHSYLGIGEDITERLKTREQMARAQKIEAVGLLAGGIAHDFNSVLTSILGSTHLAALDAVPDSDIAHEIEQIEIGARRAQVLVQQLLGFARRKSGNPVPTNLSEAVQQALRLIRAATAPTTKFMFDAKSVPAWVAADPTQLHQIIMNLCGNAAEAIGGKPGAVKITVKEDIDASRTATKEVPYWVRLQVEDNGPGMTEDVRRRVFDAFFTTKPLGKGTGLGLAVVHGLVTDMGGSIEVESIAGQGTCFTVLLPGSNASDEEASGETDTPPYGTERLLIVDDEPEVAATLRRSLMRYGYRIEAFTSATSALRSFETAPDRFDVVITDVVMPDLNGVELALRLRLARPTLPVVFLTGFAPRLDPITGPTPAIIAKPIDPKSLAKLLRKHLDAT
ncbi:PAS domain S-box-containing protein [Aliiroseovarius sediminilitoris]|uniref:histidine kinase n=1 Tax=Aliiroseovarius sediminilitoris TaxID=1173584 RepID=A0A1I0QF23_9RHOB|nr:PAS domain-containing sensor histidine kinase [Aliiroseovarius sediminilitoris]SEW25502.1 PAS domain S-box-containing protein [Aliiroseovarius sediminilitoris]